MTAPSICERTRSGLTTGPQSTAMSTRGMDEPSAVAHLDLHGGGDVADEAVVAGDAEAPPLRQRPPPADASCRGLDHAPEPAGVDRIALRVLAVVPDVADRGRIDDARRADQLEEVVLRVAARGMGELGHEGLDGESVRDVGHRPKPADAHMRGRFRILDADVGDREGRVDEPHAELERQLVLRIGREHRADGRGGAAMQPRHRLAGSVEPRFEALDRDRVVVAVMQVVLAGPGHLDRRPVHRLRAEARLDHEIGLRFPPEAAAEQGDVDPHLLDRQAEALGEARARRPAAPACRPRPRPRRRRCAPAPPAAPSSIGRDGECSIPPRRAGPLPPWRGRRRPRCGQPLPGLPAASLSRAR